jgi:hypothetical protein
LNIIHLDTHVDLKLEFLDYDNVKLENVERVALCNFDNIAIYG